MLADTELLRLYVEKDSESALTEVVGRNTDMAYSGALRQRGRDPHRARDVTQRVFAIAARKASSLCRHPVVVGWLYRTIRNEAMRAMHKEWRRQRYEKQLSNLNDSAPTPHSIEWERVGPWLDEALSDLSERDREAVVL